MRLYPLLGIATALALAPAARAEPSNSGSNLRRLELTAGGHAMLGFGSTCRQSSSDTVGCASGTAYAGLHAAPRWRLSRALSLGVLGAIAWRPSSMGSGSSDGTSTDFDQRLLRISAEVRVHPFPSEVLEPWLGLEAGFASARDSITYHGTPGRDSDVASQSGPVGSVGIGADAHLTRFFAIGLEVRGVVIPLGKDPPRLGPEGEKATAYGTITAASLGLNLTLLL